MLTNSKKTRFFALLTLVTTFVYYRYALPSADTVNIQLNRDGEVLDFQVLSADIQNLLQEQNNKNISREQQLRYGEPNEEKEDKKEVISLEEVKAKVAFVEKPSSNSSDVNIVQDDDFNKENQPTKIEGFLAKNKAEELDIIIVNNKVYHLNDTIPTKPCKFPKLKPSKGQILKDFDFDNFKPKDRKFLKDYSKEMIKRTKTVAKVCNARSKLISSESVHLIWDLKHSPNLLWCPIYKVASTSWMINFLRLAHFNEDNPDLKGMNPKKKEKNRFRARYGAKQNKVFELYPPPTDPDEFQRAFTSGLRVLIVRHPFTRLLSAYRDKMTKMDPGPPEYRFRDLQLKIIAEYRAVDSPERSPFPTFPEFIQYILDSTKNYITAKDWKDNVHCWTPYWAQCNVCGADYNVIIKLETMTEDERFLITLANLEELKDLKSQEWRHLNNSTSHEVAPEYYSQLSRIQIRQLYMRYILDFLLFDYHYRPRDYNSKEERE